MLSKISSVLSQTEVEYIHIYIYIYIFVAADKMDKNFSRLKARESFSGQAEQMSSK